MTAEIHAFPPRAGDVARDYATRAAAAGVSAELWVGLLHLAEDLDGRTPYQLVDASTMTARQRRQFAHECGLEVLRQERAEASNG